MTATTPVGTMADRRVLVTGGARGLGAAFAQALVQAGARVVITDVLHEPTVCICSPICGT